MFKNKQFDFVSNRKKFFTFSIVLIAVIIVFNLIFGVNLDIRFKGGTIISYSYTGDLDINTLDKLTEQVLEQKVSITKKSSLLGDSNSVDITLSSQTNIDAEKQSELDDVLNEQLADNELQKLSLTTVKPNIGKEFFLKCLIAVGFGSILMIVYIALRFKKISGWSAGVMAVVALLHDVFMIYGTFVILGFPINDNFIAVVLTILGYSVNDTIVIYDRIRENKRLYGNTKSISEMTNLSINQTLSRSINTTISTLMAMVVVCIVAAGFGVSSIITFAVPMLIGLISGTYSTIFVACPLWVTWQERKEKKPAKA